VSNQKVPVDADAGGVVDEVGADAPPTATHAAPFQILRTGGVALVSNQRLPAVGWVGATVEDLRLRVSMTAAVRLRISASWVPVHTLASIG
jgi:hypothetical protein